MISKTQRVCFLAVMLASAAFHANAANIVVDPGFENGTPNSYVGAMGDGWTVIAGTGAICNNNGDGCGNTGEAHTGTQMAFLDWSNTFNTITQTLTTEVGRTYTISFWIASGQANLLQVMFGGSTLLNGTAPTNGLTAADYVQYSFDSTATSTNTILAFSGQRTAGGETLLDDVSVDAVPEPATGPLLTMALLGIGILRRLQQELSPKLH